MQLLLLKGKGNRAIVPIREACPDCAWRSSSKHDFMWEGRSLKIPFLAWIDKPEASLFRCDGLDSARKAIIARSATKLTFRKQLGPPKGQDRKSLIFPIACDN